MDEREMFEAWARTCEGNCNDLDLHRENGEYAVPVVERDWIVWQAARRTTPDREAWQPIETAPRDGTQILGWCSNYGARQTHWHFYGEGSIAKAQFDAGKGESGNWYWEESLSHWLSSWNPTHWMPLPAVPGQTPVASPRDTLIEEIAEMVDPMGEGRRLEEYVGAIREMKGGNR